MVKAGVRTGAFILGLLVYAVFSTPTPDGVGLAEFIVMAGLLAGMTVTGAMQALGVWTVKPVPSWLIAARVLLLFGLSVPLIAGMAKGHDFILILRDLVPFLFLLLPLFLPLSFLERMPLRALFPYLLCAIGLIFVIKAMYISYTVASFSSFPVGFMFDPDNFVNAPTVLFGALFLTGIGGMKLVGIEKGSPHPNPLPGGEGIKSICLAVLCFGVTAIMLMGMAWVGQRAHVGAWVLAVVFWMAVLVVKRPRALLRLVPLVILAGVLLWPFVADILFSLQQKSSAVGMNNRMEEARAVWESFAGQPLALLFGQGWGATIVSPAVGPDPVNYTHNLFTSYLLKTGLAGVALVVVYLGTLAGGIWRILWVHPVAAVAVAAPFLIDITLYASFKSLDFGLLLVLIALWTRCPPARHVNSR